MAEWTTKGTVNKITVPSATAQATAQNSFTTPSYFMSYEWRNMIDLSVSNTFVGTVTLQRSFDDGTNWLDVESYTEPIEKIIENPSQSVKWRVGVKTGDFTSGTIDLRLSQA